MAGTLDTTFGTNGYTLSDFGGNIISQAYAQVIDSNNCTIVTGSTQNNSRNQLYLAKYTSRGVLDTTFGAGKGYVLGDYYTGKVSEGNSLVLDSTGNILVTGVAYDNNGVGKLLLAKYSGNGELDSSFGGGKGWITSDFGYSSADYFTIGYSLTIDSSGRILVTGGVRSTIGEGIPVLFVLARYTSSGVLDKSFGGNGTGWSNITDSTINIYSGDSVIIEKTRSSIIVLGVDQSGGLADTTPVILAKFTNNGILDTTFGSGKGYIIVEGDTWSSQSEYVGFVLDKFNRIIVTSVYRGKNTLLVRYTPDGALDTTFGENSGYTITHIPNYISSGISLVIDSNNRIVVTGLVQNSDQTINKTLLLRYTSNGILDKTFGGNGLGYSITSFGSNYSYGKSVSLDNNGRIIVSGYATVSTGQDSFIARFYNENNEPICLPAGTPILTDQGLVAIELIDPKKHTIAHKAIVAITTTISPEKHLVCFEANSMGINCPSKRTLMTPGHEVLYKGKLVQAKHFIGRVNGVHTVPYNGKDVLYNVLQETHGLMRVNNMLVETLHPENKVARQILGNLQ